MAFNYPESKVVFVPRQALAPTPELYDKLVGDTFEKLAMETISQLQPIPSGSIIHDNGCGTGGSTTAIVSSMLTSPNQVSIKATDINPQALEIFNEHAASNKWPAEAMNMDASSLSFPAETFTHSLANGVLSMLPNDGIDAVKEMHRTLKPGGFMAVNSWAYLPTMNAVQEAAKSTRPVGTPLPRQGMDKWSDPAFLQGIIEKGGFEKERIKMVQTDVLVEIGDLDQHARMLWSFVGGTGKMGWLESDEVRWEEAVGIVKRELKRSDASRLLDGGGMQLKFIANIAIAEK